MGINHTRRYVLLTNNYTTLYEGRAKDMTILNLFNKILESQGIDTIVGEVLEYTTGNKYIIEDMYNNFYKFHDGENKYYIEFSNGIEIECDTLKTLLFYSTTIE